MARARAEMVLGAPCMKTHTGLRYASGVNKGKCMECVQENNRKSHVKHREARNAKQRDYRAKKHETLKAGQRRHYAENREWVRSNQREYQDQNRENIRAQQRASYHSSRPTPARPRPDKCEAG